MRSCSVCGAEDYPIFAGTGEEGQPINDHFVKPDLIYMQSASELTPKLRFKGWSYKEFQGRPARVRFTCIECIDRESVAQQAWREIRAEAETLETIPNQDKFYNDLCND